MTRTAVVAVSCLLLAGCAAGSGPSASERVRLKAPKPARLEAARHWPALAERIAAHVAAQAKTTTEGREVVTPVTLASDPTTPFDTAFRSLVISALFRRGIPVLVDAPLRLSWHLQPVLHAEHWLRRQELIMTTQLIDDRGARLMHRSDVYAVDAADLDQYLAAPPAMNGPRPIVMQLNPQRDCRLAETFAEIRACLGATR